MLEPNDSFCVVCRETINTDEFLCSCTKHKIHTEECLSAWVSDQWGLQVPELVNTRQWRTLKGCPICSDAPLIEKSEIIQWIPKLSCSFLSDAVKAAILTNLHEPSPVATNSLPPSSEGIVSDLTTKLVSQLQEMTILRCPSCSVPFLCDDATRGCDAVWCTNENCRRAFCLLCLEDCGDHMKTDKVAQNDQLVGDAHSHVVNNDCGLTIKGLLFTSNENIMKIHQKRIKRKQFMKLIRVKPEIATVAKSVLGITETEQEMIDFLRDSNTLEVCTTESSDANHSIGSNNRVNDKIGGVPWYLRVQRRFLHAADTGHIHLVEKLLHVGIDVNVEDENKLGETALMFASLRGRTRVVKLLLRHGALALHTSKAGKNALHYVSDWTDGGCVDTARVLVRAAYAERPYTSNADISFWYPWSIPMNGGGTPLSGCNSADLKAYFTMFQSIGSALMKSCHEGDVGRVRSLLNHENIKGVSEKVAMAVAEDVFMYQDPGRDATDGLMFAASRGNMAVVELMLKVGVSPWRADNNGWTALHYASRHGHLQVCRVLVRAAFRERGNGNNPSNYRCSRHLPWLVTARDGKVRPLDLSESFPDLLAYFTRLEHIGNRMLLSCYQGKLEELKSIVIHVIDDDEEEEEVNKAVAEDVLFYQDRERNATNGLMFASAEGHISVVEWLIRHGMCVLDVDMQGGNCLHYAHKQGNLQLMRILVRGAFAEQRQSDKCHMRFLPWAIPARDAYATTAISKLVDYPKLVSYFFELERKGLLFLNACANGLLGEVKTLLLPDTRGGDVCEDVATAVAEDIVNFRHHGSFDGLTPLILALKHKMPEDGIGVQEGINYNMSSRSSQCINVITHIVAIILRKCPNVNILEHRRYRDDSNSLNSSNSSNSLQIGSSLVHIAEEQGNVDALTLITAYIERKLREEQEKDEQTVHSAC